MKTFQPVKWNYLFFPIAQIDSSAGKGGFSSAVSMAMFSPNGSLLCAVGADGEAGNGTNDQWANDQLIITNPIPQEQSLGWLELFKPCLEYSKILSIFNVDQLARDPLSHPWGALVGSRWLQRTTSLPQGAPWRGHLCHLFPRRPVPWLAAGGMEKLKIFGLSWLVPPKQDWT